MYTEIGEKFKCMLETCLMSIKINGDIFCEFE